MKRSILRAAATVLLCTALLPSLASCGKSEPTALPRLSAEAIMDTQSPILDPASEVRGVWIASVFNIDFPSYPGLDASTLKGELDSILDTCEENGLNTVFFQVRPACDALYKSELYPVSSFLSTDGELEFDPLEYIVAEAHKRNIFVHGWINPLRVTVSANSEDKLPEDSPAKLHPEWTVKYEDGKLYLNAGLPEVRDYVAEGVREILSLYDVDGIVFDDYFYPYPVNGADFDDGDAYAEYGGSLSVGDWRRENINSLIESCYNAVKETSPRASFGVSPGGIWQNNNGVNGGSETRGFETYTSLYCDSVAWINGGYIDYIAPQIYWTFDTSSAPYGELVDWWTRIVDGTGVKLLVANGVYRYEDGDWESPSGEMTAQVEYARQTIAYRGSVYYGYDEIKRNTNGASDEIKALNTQEIIYCAYTKDPEGVVFTSHSDGDEVAAGYVTVTGISDPTKPLHYKGEKLKRYRSGMFELSLLASLGANEIELVLDGTTYTLTLNGTLS